MFSKRTVIIAALAAAAILTATDVALAHGTTSPGRVKKMSRRRARFARASFRGAQWITSPPLISIALRHQDEIKLTGDQVAKLIALRDTFSRKWIRTRDDLQITNLYLRKNLQEDAVNLEVVGRQIRDIEKKKADLRLERIRALEEGKALLTEDQRKQLLSFVQSGPRRGVGPHFCGMKGPGAAPGGSPQGEK
jgi:hypothetical protein